MGSAASEETILIAGGGMAGSLLALVLGRAGRSVVVIDPKRDPAPVFRNEKLGHAQIALLRTLGALDCFERACWPDGAYPAGERPALHDCGAPHHEWLRAVRAAWPQTVRFVEASVESALLLADRQSVTLSNGARLEGRLFVLATGRMPALAASLGVERRMLSAGHSVCLGFSVACERPLHAQIMQTPFGSGVGYVSLFPMPGETRVNVFSYRPLSDPWTRRMAADPLGALAEVCPQAAEALAGARVVRRCEARGTDLYETAGHLQPGLLMLGDAYHAPCPASGTGMLRILNDVDVLANRWAPQALATPGLGVDKVTRFYVDRVKRGVDTASVRQSKLGRANAVNTGALWSARRAIRAMRAEGSVITPWRVRPRAEPASAPVR